MPSQANKRTPKDFEPASPDTPASEDLATTSAAALINNADLDHVILNERPPSPIRASDTVIEQSRIQGPALAASTLPNARFTDCAFDAADLSAATWIDARIITSTFTNCKLTGFDARGAELRDVTFKDCKLPDAFFQDTTLTRVRFENCQLPNLDLAGATVKSLAIRNSDAQSLRLVSTKIDHLDLRGSIIDNLAIDPMNLNGIIISPVQAPAIASALGVVISSD